MTLKKMPRKVKRVQAVDQVRQAATKQSEARFFNEINVCGDFNHRMVSNVGITTNKPDESSFVHRIDECLLLRDNLVVAPFSINSAIFVYNM